MPLLPVTLALVVGILIGAWVWDAGWFSCEGVFWPRVQNSSWVKVAISLTVVGFLPLLAPFRPDPSLVLLQARGVPSSGENRRFDGKISFLVYLVLGVLLAWVQPAEPCVAANHVRVLAQEVGEQGQYGVLTGVVVAWPEQRGNRAQYVVAAETLVLNGRRLQVEGRLLVRAKVYPELSYGTRARFVGWFRLPPVYETFDYRRYLARQGIYAIFYAREIIPLARGKGSWWWQPLYALRRHVSMMVESLFPEPYGALVNGILLGIESGIPPALREAFNATGTSHILVISGFNIALLSGLVIALLTPVLGRRRAALAALLVIAMYVPLVGAEAAVVRAGIMGGVSAVGMYLQRQAPALNSLFAAALLMLSMNPNTLWDVGFQLSFLATLGLIVVHPALLERIERYLKEDSRHSQWFHWVDEALLVTVTAQLMTTPLIVAVFGRISFISLLANALIVPVQSFIMMGGILSVVLGWLWWPVGQMVAWGTMIPLMWTVFVVEEMAQWPGAGVPLPSAVRPLVWIYYAGVAAYVGRRYMQLYPGSTLWHWPCPWFSVERWRAWRRYKIHWRWIWGAVVLIAMVGAGGYYVAQDRSERALWVMWPGGSAGLRVTSHLWLTFPARGPRTTNGVVNMGVLVERQGDIWVITHSDAETLAAVRVILQESRPLLLIHPPFCEPRWPCPEHWWLFLRALAELRVPHRSLAPGVQATFGDRVGVLYLTGVWSEVLSPVWIVYGKWIVLFPSDIPPHVQRQLPRPPEEKQLLWPLPGVASGAWPDPEALQRLRPALTLYPEDATYPPASAQGVSAVPRMHFDPEQRVTILLTPEGDHTGLPQGSPGAK